jgi:hypothetical protein
VADNTVTVVILNTGTSAKSAALVGTGLPSQFDVYQSTSSTVCVKTGTATTTVALPAQSITTLYNGTIPQYPYGTTAVRGTTPQTVVRNVAADRSGPQRIVSLDGRMIGRAPAGAYCTVGRSGMLRVVMPGR